MIDVVFNGPGGAQVLYKGRDMDEAQRICGQVLRHNPGLRPITADDGAIAQWDDPHNALMMQLREVADGGVR